MPDSEVRGQYLGLALDSRKLVDELIRYLDKGERDPLLGDDLKSARESIVATTSSQNVLALFSRLSNQSVFSHYEQLRVIREVCSSLGNPDIAASINNIINEAENEANQERDAFAVLRFFSALEARALHDYNVQMQAPRR